MQALILEDERDRRVAMVQRLMERFPFLRITFFDTAASKITHLEERELSDLVVIALDNDLELIAQPSGAWLDPGTGLDVAKWLAGLPVPLCPVVVHTTNSPFAERMMACLTEAKWTVERVVAYDDLTWIDREWFWTMRRLIVDFAPSVTLSSQDVDAA